MLTTNRAGPGIRNSVQVPTWVAGTLVLGPSGAAFLRYINWEAGPEAEQLPNTCLSHISEQHCEIHLLWVLGWWANFSVLFLFPGLLLIFISLMGHVSVSPFRSMHIYYLCFAKY